MAAWLRGRKLVRGAFGGLCALLAGCATGPVSGDGSGAAAASRPALADTERFGTLMRLGDAARRSGDWHGAASLYQQASALDPNAPRGHIALGEALLEAGNPSAAGRSFQEALKLAPGDRDAERGYARVLIELGEPGEAVSRYARLVEADPADVRAINGLGVAHDLAGQHDAAQAAYRRGLALEPDHLALRNNLALSLVLAGRPGEAIPILNRVVGSPGATARNRQNLALAYGLAGDRTAAERLGRVDLDDRAVRQNLAFYAEVRGEGTTAEVAPAPARERSAPAPARDGSRATSGSAPPPAAAGPTASAVEAPVTRPIVIKLEAQLSNRAAEEPAAEERAPGTAGPMPGAEDRARAVADATAPARPTAPADAEPDGGSAAAGSAVDAVTVGGQGVELGSSAAGSWFLELGDYADGREATAAWRALRERHGAMLSGLNRLASIDGGRQQLLIGPVGSGAEARDLCRRLRGDGQPCRALLL